MVGGKKGRRRKYEENLVKAVGGWKSGPQNKSRNLHTARRDLERVSEVNGPSLFGVKTSREVWTLLKRVDPLACLHAAPHAKALRNHRTERQSSKDLMKCQRVERHRAAKSEQDLPETDTRHGRGRGNSRSLSAAQSNRNFVYHFVICINIIRYLLEALPFNTKCVFHIHGYTAYGISPESFHSLY